MHSSVEKTFYNIEICLNIFQYFDLNEQLQLTRVCEQFHNIIQNFLWKNTIKELQIFACEPNVIVVSNKINKRDCWFGTYRNTLISLAYGDSEIEHINDKISIYFKNIMDLKDFVYINRDNLDKLQLIETQSCENELLDFIWEYKFTNLTELALDDVNQFTGLRGLSSICPNLKTLVLRTCHPNGNSILQDPIIIASIATVKSLKKFVLYDRRIHNQNIIPIIAKNLMQLNEIILKDIEMSPGSRYGLIHLGSLNIRNSVPTDWVLEKPLLNRFQNLQTLAVIARKSRLVIDRNVLEILIKLCPTLRKLSLEFCEFEDFIAIPSLETLILVCADRIKWKMLETILKQKNLKSFTSVFTSICKDFENCQIEYFEIESPLQYLRFEISECDLRNELHNLLEFNIQSLAQLNTFIWHDFDKGIYRPIHINHFRKLESLFIDMELIDIEDIMGMERLTNLSIIKNDRINIENLLRMLRHPSLKNFTLYTNESACKLKGYPDNLNSFTTNLLTIKIPFNFFESCSHIWLKLLNENSKLSIFCYFPAAIKTVVLLSFLMNLIANIHFPERIKSFKICGFTIDRDSMQTNIDEVINKIEIASRLCCHFDPTMYLQL